MLGRRNRREQCGKGPRHNVRWYLDTRSVEEDDIVLYPALSQVQSERFALLELGHGETSPGEDLLTRKICW